MVSLDKRSYFDFFKYSCDQHYLGDAVARCNYENNRILIRLLMIIDFKNQVIEFKEQLLNHSKHVHNNEILK